MLARVACAILALAVPAAVHAGGAQLAISAVVLKRVQLSTQGDLLVVRSNSREGVALNFGTTTIVVPGGVQVLDLRALGVRRDARITASPL